MTQLVPDEWNEWHHEKQVDWWHLNLVELGLPNYMPFFGQDKIPGIDVWIRANGTHWKLEPNPWHPGRYRWETYNHQSNPNNHPLFPGKLSAPRQAEWEADLHAERDSVKTLREAEQIITGDRYNDYGPPAENFGRIATYWNQYLKDNPPPLKPSDTAMLMVFVKIAREAAGHKTDSVVDAEGYLAIYEELRNHEIADEEEFE